MKNSLNEQIGGDYENFRDNSVSSQSISRELQERTENIKRLIDQYDEISAKVEELDQKYEEKAKTLFDSDKLPQLKNALNKIKKEVFSMNVQVGVYRGHLSREQAKEGGDAFSMYKLINGKTTHQQDADDSFEI